MHRVGYSFRIVSSTSVDVQFLDNIKVFNLYHVFLNIPVSNSRHQFSLSISILGSEVTPFAKYVPVISVPDRSSSLRILTEILSVSCSPVQDNREHLISLRISRLGKDLTPSSKPMPDISIWVRFSSLRLHPEVLSISCSPLSDSWQHVYSLNIFRFWKDLIPISKPIPVILVLDRFSSRRLPPEILSISCSPLSDSWEHAFSLRIFRFGRDLIFSSKQIPVILVQDRYSSLREIPEVLCISSTPLSDSREHSSRSNISTLERDLIPSSKPKPDILVQERPSLLRYARNFSVSPGILWLSLSAENNVQGWESLGLEEI